VSEKPGISEVVKMQRYDDGRRLRLWQLVYQFTRKVTG